MQSDDSLTQANAQSQKVAVTERLGKIENSLKTESWLPMGLRGMLASEIPYLRKLASHKGASWKRKLSKQVMTVALLSWMYGPSPLESETMSQLRVLDLELNGTEYAVSENADTPNRP